MAEYLPILQDIPILQKEEVGVTYSSDCNAGRSNMALRNLVLFTKIKTPPPISLECEAQRHSVVGTWQRQSRAWRHSEALNSHEQGTKHLWRSTLQEGFCSSVDRIKRKPPAGPFHSRGIYC